MLFSVKKQAKTLCEQCSYSQIITITDNNQIARCSYGMKDIIIPYQKITACSTFREKSALSLQVMEKIAYILTTNEKNVLGFRPPKPQDND